MLLFKGVVLSEGNRNKKIVYKCQQGTKKIPIPAPSSVRTVRW
jgi:hypothetical protein